MGSSNLENEWESPDSPGKHAQTKDNRIKEKKKSLQIE